MFKKYILSTFTWFNERMNRWSEKTTRNTSAFTFVELRINYARISILVYSPRNQNRNC